MSKFAREQKLGGWVQEKYKSGKGRIPTKHFSIVVNNCIINGNQSDLPEQKICPRNHIKDDLPDFKDHHHKDVATPPEQCHQGEAIFEKNFYHDEPIQESYCHHESPELEQETEVMYCCNANDHHHCIPRKGEMMINGGFENRQDVFFGWVINSGVDEIDVSKGDIAHQGLSAVRLGFLNPHAFIYQNVPGICPGSYYQLNFFMSGAIDSGSVPVNIRMEFLDQFKNPLNNPALDILIPEDSLSEIAYTGFCNTTQSPAPPNTHFARVRFETAKHIGAKKYVHLDDVSLIAL